MSQHSSIPFNPELQDIDRGHEMVILVSVFTVLVVLATAVRIGTKIYDRINLRVEDYFIVLGLIFNLTCNAINYKCVVSTFRMFSQYTLLFATLALWAVKLSISFFILGLIRRTHKWLRWSTYGLITITTVSSFCQLMLWGLQAMPLEKLWNPEVPGTVTSKQTLVVSIYVFTAMFCITDLFYALAPLYFLGGVQMSLKTKSVILALTGSGLLVFAVSVVRLCFMAEFFDPDQTWALRNVFVCTVIERNLAAIIANLPGIYPLVRNLQRKIATLTARTRTGTKKTRTAGSGRNGRFAARSNARYSEFGASSKQDRLGAVEAQHKGGGGRPPRFWFDGFGDDVPLRDEPPGPEPEPVLQMDGQSIEVETNIDVQTQQTQLWPMGSRRPKV